MSDQQSSRDDDEDIDALIDDDDDQSRTSSVAYLSSHVFGTEEDRKRFCKFEAPAKPRLELTFSSFVMDV